MARRTKRVRTKSADCDILYKALGKDIPDSYKPIFFQMIQNLQNGDSYCLSIKQRAWVVNSIYPRKGVRHSDTGFLNTPPENLEDLDLVIACLYKNIPTNTRDPFIHMADMLYNRKISKLSEKQRSWVTKIFQSH